MASDATRVKPATGEQLAGIVGPKVAERIREYYADDTGEAPRSTVGGSVGAGE